MRLGDFYEAPTAPEDKKRNFWPFLYEYGLQDAYWIYIQAKTQPLAAKRLKSYLRKHLSSWELERTQIGKHDLRVSSITDLANQGSPPDTILLASGKTVSNQDLKQYKKGTQFDLPLN